METEQTLATTEPEAESTVINSNLPVEPAAAEPSLATTEPKVEPTVPDQYEFTFPDEFEVDPELVKEFSPLAKEFGLSQESAQKLVDLNTKFTNRVHEQNTAAFKKVIGEWATSSKEDKEFGGAKFNENISVAQEALNKFGNDEFKKLLDSTGIGNHPEVIRVLYKVGKMLREDKFHSGSNPDPSNRDVAKMLYTTMS